MRLRRNYNKIFAPFAFAIVGVAAVPISAKSADYLLGRGDTVEVTVTAGAQAVRRAQIGVNGSISMPLLGDVQISGLSPSNAALKIATLYRERKIYDQVEAMVDVTAYRPVFVSGAVAKPGPYEFRPGMTIRQLVAMAGDQEPVGQTEGQIPAVLRHEYNEANTRFVSSQIRSARLRAELDGKLRFDETELDVGDADLAQFAKVIESERSQMEGSVANNVREQDHLSRSVVQIKEQILAIEGKIVDEAASVELAQADLDRLKSAFSKGIIAAPRLGDTQQAVALSKIRYAESIARLAETRRLLADTERRAERLKAEYRLNVLEALKQQSIEVERTRSAVMAARAKLDRAKVSPLQITPTELVVSVHPAEAKGFRIVDHDAELLAGDTVSIVRMSSARIR